MAAQPIDLVLQGCLRDIEILRRPFAPAFPVIAATPARHDEDSFAVRVLEELLRFQLAFEANRIQPHVTHVAELVRQALRTLTKQHIGCPAAAPNQDLLAIDGEYAPLVWI